MTDLSDRYADAVRWAVELHAGQVRKATSVPYVSHVLAVSVLVIEHGGGEDEAIAAVLHDAIEDTVATRGDIEDRFGSNVASIVDQCSDADGSPKPPWRERKQQHLQHLAGDAVGSDVLLVVAADKLHNLRSVLVDFRQQGDRLWGRFNAGPDDQLWYYRGVGRVLEQRLGGSIAHEVSRAVDELAAIVER